jgi:hypothetical protein
LFIYNFHLKSIRFKSIIARGEVYKVIP